MDTSVGVGTTAASTRSATDLAADLYALVLHLHKNCSPDLLEAVGTLELSLSQIKLMHYLQDAPREQTLKEAAELVHVSLPAASRMVDDLVRRGFLERHEDAVDRRMKRVNLTDQGSAIIRQVNAARLTGLEEFVSGLSQAEQDLLAKALAKLLAHDEIADCRPDRA